MRNRYFDIDDIVARLVDKEEYRVPHTRRPLKTSVLRKRSRMTVTDVNRWFVTRYVTRLAACDSIRVKFLLLSFSILDNIDGPCAHRAADCPSLC